jgi:hypothetical protein
VQADVRVAGLGGRRVATTVAAFLARGAWPAAVPVVCEPPLLWTSPSAIAPGDAALGRVVARVGEPRTGALAVTQDGRTLWRGGRRRLVPNRSIAMSGGWIAAVAPDAGPISVRIAP